MAADAGRAFLRQAAPGIEVAARFRTHILSDGNTIDRAEAYGTSAAAIRRCPLLQEGAPRR
jgi:hypothetical protein